MRKKRSLLVPAVLCALLKSRVPSGVRLSPMGLPHGEPLDKYSYTDLKLSPLDPNTYNSIIICSSCRDMLIFLTDIYADIKLRGIDSKFDILSL